MIKKLSIKIVLTVIAFFASSIAIWTLVHENRAESPGYIYLIIENYDGEVLFDDQLLFFEGDSFFDILNRAFTLTCADAMYGPDTTCGHEFSLGPQFGTNGQKDYVILGIKGDHFDVMTNWYDQFLAFEKYQTSSYVLTTRGPSNISFDHQDKFRIQVRGTQINWGNGS